jgi:probable rRNA maturation factor
VTHNIRFFSEEIRFRFSGKRKYRTWILGVIDEENKNFSNINYIFCSDDYLYELNKRYLQHNSYTDILTFPDLSNPEQISGDIYISVERIKENAGKYRQSFDTELARVMVHGVLHLVGYKDKNAGEKELMTRKENYYLDKYLLL